MARLLETYKTSIVEKLRKELNAKNVHEVPKMTKIVVSIGLGEAVANSKVVDAAQIDLTSIVGQKPVVTRAKKAISNFKLRKGYPIGLMVTLRGKKMYEFYDRLVNVSLARVRDFKGVSNKAFDGRGNYTLGLKDQTIFPEINYDKIDKVRGMNVTIVTTAKTDESARMLLANLGMPFRKN